MAHICYIVGKVTLGLDDGNTHMLALFYVLEVLPDHGFQGAAGLAGAGCSNYESVQVAVLVGNDNSAAKLYVERARAFWLGTSFGWVGEI